MSTGSYERERVTDRHIDRNRDRQTDRHRQTDTDTDRARWSNAPKASE